MNADEYKAYRREYMRQWRIKNPDKARANDKNNRVRNREKMLARKAKYRRDNRGKVYKYVAEYELRNPERVAAWRKTKAERHPEFCRTRSSNRRAREANAIPKWADAKKIREIYKNCAMLAKETGIKYQVDHIVPLAGKDVCGLHVHNNLQILTAIENRKKWIRWE